MSKFTPSSAEVALVNQIFAQADTQKLGVITGEAAVKIFSGSKLSPAVLAEIWNLADDENNGVLTRKGVAVAVRLLGHAQRGENVTEALVNKRECSTKCARLTRLNRISKRARYPPLKASHPHFSNKPLAFLPQSLHLLAFPHSHLKTRLSLRSCL